MVCLLIFNSRPRVKVRSKRVKVRSKRVKVRSKASSQGHVRVIICGKNLEEWVI